MPVRKITNAGGKLIRLFPSLKMKRGIWCESPLEHDYAYLLEFDQNVLSYEEQPIKIYATVDGVKHEYTPDFKLKAADGIIIVEVKPFQYLTKHQTLLQIAIGTEFCKTQGYTFKVLTEREIRSGNLLKNVKLLCKYSRIKPALRDYNKIFNVLAKSGVVSIDELATKLKQDGFNGNPLPIIYHLIYVHSLNVDLNKPVNGMSIIIGGN